MALASALSLAHVHRRTPPLLNFGPGIQHSDCGADLSGGGPEKNAERRTGEKSTTRLRHAWLQKLLPEPGRKCPGKIE